METKKSNFNYSEGQKKVKKIKLVKPAGIAAGVAMAGAVGQKIISKALRSKPGVNEEASKDEELLAKVQPEVEADDMIEVIPDMEEFPSEEEVSEDDTQEENLVSDESSEEINEDSYPTTDEMADARNKIGGEDIDPTDFNGSSNYTVTGFTVLKDQDGNELPAAVVEDEECNQYALADLDGDGYFESFMNREGYRVSFIEGSNLTLDDLENMAYNDGGYLPISQEEVIENDDVDIVENGNTEDNLDNDPAGENTEVEEEKPEYLANIINTENGENPDVDMMETVDDTNVIDDLISQLLGSDEEETESDDLLAEEDMIEDDSLLDEFDENA